MDKTIAAIIFDMDGVIADSEHLHVEAERATFQKYGIPVVGDTSEFIGQTEQAFFTYIVQRFTNGAYSVEELLLAKQDIFLRLLSEKLQPVPGALEFIRSARSRYAKFALVTSSARIVQKKVFDLFQLQPYFDRVITGDEIQQGKPHPEPYLKAIDAIRIPAGQCLVIEDSVNGIVAARTAGCRAIGITTSFPEEPLIAAGAEWVIREFSALYHQL